MTIVLPMIIGASLGGWYSIENDFSMTQSSQVIKMIVLRYLWRVSEDLFGWQAKT